MKRARENNESLVSDTQNAQTSTPMSSDVDGENGVAESPLNSNSNTHDNGNGYNLRSKNPRLLKCSNADSDDDGDDGAVTSNLRPERLQQPPVYINTSLMKVKMESDYVQVYGPKEEPADETITSGMDESELNAHAHENESPINSIPTPTSEGTSEKSERGQQKTPNQTEQNQAKKKVTVEVEADLDADADVNDAPTSREPVVTGIERKEKKVKTRVKMTLEKEMARLNLVIEGLRTENQDLNSTTSEQRDQIIQLNHQLNQQQEEIQELKSKLEAHSENQQVVEKSNVEPNPIQIIRDFPTKVLSRIFDHLDIKSLKESRLVCRQWRNEAGKILLQNFCLVCDETERCEKALKNWIENPNSNPTSTTTAAPTAAVQKLWFRDAKLALQLLAKFPKLNISVRELKFSNAQSTAENLYEILKLFPNLKVLETGKLDFYPKQNFWLADPGSDSDLKGNALKLELLLRKLETLEKLKLDFRETKGSVRNFLAKHKRFASVKSLEIYAAGPSFPLDFLGQNHKSGVNLNITRFTLNVDETYKVNLKLIRSFLQKISPSLQHLKLIVAQDTFRSLSLSPSEFHHKPWNDDWMIPIGLTRVETLEIGFLPQQITVALDEFILKSILVALRLPRLKKLAVGFIPEDLQQIVYKWNGHSFFESATGNGRKLSSASLEELEILESFSKSSISCRVKIPANPWPRLKSLKCSWMNPAAFDASMLSRLKRVERLQVNIILNWNPYENAEDERNHNRNSSKFQLKDLKELKSFCLNVSSNSDSSRDFANYLVEEDLSFMTSLQLVQFRRVIIDPELLQFALGPNVPIIFTD